MARNNYTPEYKARIVLKVLQGEQELGSIAAEEGINPNLLRNWKREFVENASRAFDETRQVRSAKRKEEALEKEKTQMLKTIGQLTLERDFLQDTFRRAGKSIPRLNQD